MRRRRGSEGGEEEEKEEEAAQVGNAVGLGFSFLKLHVLPEQEGAPPAAPLLWLEISRI